ncbi:glycosyltransferase [Aldersonia sp. NBC_00410]|uniref:glycosyltransferase family 2 protein n=1 Tax=Aldersonia sp. NBC_00410 TaxID=2975954 RepID=UPI0022598355|nr:glycosyltransferase [Aldersonia sp. NBC_00410]MCX5041691.1 glycosyltransferase [Aldersonia sp. NBC_00410]
MPAVSVVIPTVGRQTLGRAVRSVLAQTLSPVEIVVVADTLAPVPLPADPRLSLLRAGPGAGSARARQIGIDAARGDVVALLDDDDEWHPEKLARQLEAVADRPTADWVVTSRSDVIGPGVRRRVWPRRVIEPGQSVADYLYRRTDLRSGGAVLQTSTLSFPTRLARVVRWDANPDAAHDEATWLLGLQESVPQLRIVQLEETLATYYIGDASLSNSRLDRSAEYIQWGLAHLRDEPARVRGDYLCTSPVSAAVSAGSIRSVGSALYASVRYGRPGPYALAYAAGNAARLVAQRIWSAFARWNRG